MKLFKQIAIVAALALCGLAASAQTATNTAPLTGTNAMPTFSAGLQELYDSVTVSTNYAVALGAGRATTGDRNLAYADYIYNVSQNVGLVIGGEHLWTSKKAGIPSQSNVVKGGITLSAQIYPLKNFGLTNVCMTPFANGLVATGGGTASTIVTVGDKINLATFSGWNLGLAGMYEKRSNAGYWTANYVCGMLALSKGF